MRYLSVEDVIRLHRKIIEEIGGEAQLLDRDRLESSVHQIRQTAGGKDLYPNIEEKAAALCFFLVKNHAFEDGNKRIGHAATEVFLRLNGKEFEAEVDEQERVMFDLQRAKYQKKNSSNGSDPILQTCQKSSFGRSSRCFSHLSSFLKPFFLHKKPSKFRKCPNFHLR